MGAVLFLHSFEVSGNGFKGFFPGDGFKFSPYPLSCPFQWNGKSVGGIYDIALGQSPGTGFQTRAELVIGGNSLNLSLIYVDLQKAAAPAVVGTGAGYDPGFPGRLIIVHHIPTLSALRRPRLRSRLRAVSTAPNNTKDGIQIQVISFKMTLPSQALKNPRHPMGETITGLQGKK